MDGKSEVLSLFNLLSLYLVSFPSLKIINTPDIFLDLNNENLLSLKHRTKKYRGTCRWNTKKKKKKRNNRIFSSFQTNEISKNRIFFFFFLFFANYYIRVRMRAQWYGTIRIFEHSIHREILSDGTSWWHRVEEKNPYNTNNGNIKIIAVHLHVLQTIHWFCGPRTQSGEFSPKPRQ